MWFTRVILFIVLLAFGTFALAKPVVTVAVKTRGDDVSLGLVENVLTDLEAIVNEILPQINGATSGGNVTVDSLGPLLDELIAALTDAGVSLDSIVPASSDASDSDIVDLLAGIVNEIVVSLEPLTGLSTGLDILSNLDGALSQVLTVVNALSGVISLVASLVSPLSGVLALLGLDGTLTALGLGL